jgi:hypothetical protein
VNDGENVNLLRFYVVNDPIGAFDDFADGVYVILGNSAPREWILGYLLRSSGKPIDRAPGIMGRILRDI